MKTRARGENALHQAVRSVPGFHLQAQYIMAACARTLEETPELQNDVETMAACIQGLSPSGAAYLLASIGLYANEMATENNDHREISEDCSHDGDKLPGDHRD